MRKEGADAAERCRELERKYNWIPSEQHHFGKPGTDYDWNARDPSQVGGWWGSGRRAFLEGASENEASPTCMVKLPCVDFAGWRLPALHSKCQHVSSRSSAVIPVCAVCAAAGV